MLNDFFRLNPKFKTFDTYQELVEHFEKSNDLRNVLFKPDLAPTGGGSFKGRNFNNVSLSKKKISQVTFTRCEFTDCLFIGSEFDKCEFHDCVFKHCNFYKCSFSGTYIDPAALRDVQSRRDHSNIGVALYSALRLNSAQMYNRDFEAEADYQFRRWKRYQLEYEYRQKEVTTATFLRKWIPDVVFYGFAGYGYKARYFVFWTLVLLALFTFLNRWAADDFLIARPIGSANTYSYGLYQTIATLTTLGSNAEALTLTALGLLAVQAIVGVLWLSVLTAIVVKKVVR